MGTGPAIWRLKLPSKKRRLYIAGPFQLIQGGLGIAGRLPVFLTDEQGQRYFWGIVSVTLDFPAASSGSSVERVNARASPAKFGASIRTTDRNSDSRDGGARCRRGVRTVDHAQELFNSVWTVSLAPLRPWYLQITCGWGWR